LFGVLVGVYLRRKDITDSVKVSWLFSIGILALLAGLVWDLQFPINKSLWTSSFVLYTGGWATILLSLTYWLIDINGYKKFTKPFVVYGVNAITVFFLSGLMPRIMSMIKVEMPDGKVVGSQTWLYDTFIVPYFSPLNASLVYAVLFILFWYVILWIMYKRNIIIKV
jgi:predicted acyltransferase